MCAGFFVLFVAGRDVPASSLAGGSLRERRRVTVRNGVCVNIMCLCVCVHVYTRARVCHLCVQKGKTTFSRVLLCVDYK